MNDLKISIPDDRTEFEPGDEVSGMVYWNLDQQPELVELRLFWFTRGKGTEDVSIVSADRFEHPPAQATRPFRFMLPDGPCSFSGRLISLVWSLELVVQPVRHAKSIELVVAPGGKEVQLETVDDGEPKRPWFRRRRIQ